VVLFAQPHDDVFDGCHPLALQIANRAAENLREIEHSAVAPFLKGIIAWEK
jgi:hypothetical protein